MSLQNPALEAFLSVSNHGTVLAASKDMGLTQTGVTQRIRLLEKQLGLTLFTRSRKGMQLTREGETLLHYAKKAFDLESEALLELGLGSQVAPPEVSICVSPELLETRVLKNLKTLLQRTPLLRLDILSTSAEESVNLLKSAKVQFALLHSVSPVREMEHKKLSSLQFHFIRSKSLPKKSWMEVLKTESFILSKDLPDLALRFLQKSKVDLATNHKVPHQNSARAAAAEGVGFTLSPIEELEQKPNKYSKIPNSPTLDLPVSLLWYPRKNMPHYLKNVLIHLVKPS